MKALTFLENLKRFSTQIMGEKWQDMDEAIAELKDTKNLLAELEATLNSLKAIAENPKWDILFRDFLRAAMDGTLNEECTKERIG